MLNLSDKELDRLSREAASEHDPGGSMLSPGAWEKLEWQLDKELGKFGSPSPLRGIRRIPYYYYASAILLLVGVSYYVIKNMKGRIPASFSVTPVISKTEPSGSPPLTSDKAGKPGNTTNDPSSKTSDHSSNSTSTPDKEHSNEQALRSGSAATLPEGQPRQGQEASSASNASSVPNGSPATNTSSASNDSTQHVGINASHSPTRKKGKAGTGQPGSAGLADNNAGDNSTGQDRTTQASQSSKDASHDGAASPREPAWSVVRAPASLTKSPSVKDSALRAFKVVQGPIHPDHKNSQHVNRSLHLGFVVAPDFASVNSLAGDKPGSSVGLTLDYQFANRWYVSSGLLFTTKIYSARSQDFHAPPSFYQSNNMPDINFVKGGLTMLEIPLNIRYDFSISNNTIFFASGGLSSYLMTNEKCNYYFNYFGREIYVPFKYNPNASYFFNTINLSFGVEAGISNSLSLSIAPYMKFPAGGNGIGFGQVQISSVGINFGLKYAPVLSRKRK